MRLMHKSQPPAVGPLLALLVLCCDLVSGERFLMGYLTGSERKGRDQEYPRPGRMISGAINLAMHEIATSTPLVNGHSLDFAVAETYGLETESLRQVVRLYNMNVSVFIGPQETCVHEGRMAASLNLPMISYFCTNYETSNKRLFPTFARTRPPDTQISKSVLSLLLRYQWLKVAFLYKDSADSVLGPIGETIVSVLRHGGISLRHVVTWNETYHDNYMVNPFSELVRRTKDDVRIYVILGEYFEHRALLMTLQEMKLLDTGEYFVVGVDIQRYQDRWMSRSPDSVPQKYLRTLFEEASPTDPRAEEAFRHYIGVMGSPAIRFEELTKLVNEYMEMPPFNFSNILKQYGGHVKILPEAAYLYDAVHLYAWSLNETLKSGGNPRNGSAIIGRLLNRSYFSAMGYMVYMDEHGDAEGNYTVVQRRSVGGRIGLHPAGVFQLRAGGSDLPELVISDPLQWPSGQPPIDEPECGFRGEYCISYTKEIASGIVGGVVLVIIVIGLVLYRNWQYEQELDSLLWKIDYKEIQMHDETDDVRPALVTDSFSSRVLLRSSQVSLSSNYDMDFRYTALYTRVGLYKGRMVAVKDIRRKTIDITRRMKKELKKMRDLRHDNLNPFIGACVDPPHLCTVSDYCTRGSLRDILENANVKLDNMFIASMVFDIVRGMMFLHDSPLRYHGNLKTTNCLVDSRWVVKVADFGLADIINRSDHHLETEKDVRQKCEDLLFRAPEQLRCSSAEAGSQKADVYSFAMVLYEIHSRSPPFAGMGLGPLELLQSVIKRSSNNNPVFRPPIHMLETCFDCVRTVLAECWAEEPDLRPDFKAVRNKLRPMRKGMKPHIFDNMITMMEKYTNNLEMLVDERTNLLIVEKKKTEALLHEMLPRYVADQLKRGNSVQAESFDSVTIYFSDIVGFTAMSAESTPLQVVDFLNDLYTCFDSIIDNYDVYKVETIGDAYMVVSGLPVRNGLQHAGEVASMSLHLLEAIRSFTIRHRPQDTLMLRIGIHTGPVCAGVVGRKMPRYCLYGDTVNTASRMESTGSPLRIHCSASCRSVLLRLGGYNLEERGPTYLKGKGDVVTYWLVGEDERRQARRRQNITKMRQQQQIPRGALRSRASAMERTCSLESPRRLRFAADRRRELGQLSPPGLAAGCECDAQRRSCPCIHELGDETSSPAGERGRSGAWLTVVVPEHGSRSDSALHGVQPRPRFELDLVSDVTESEPLLAGAPGGGETRI